MNRTGATDTASEPTAVAHESTVDISLSVWWIRRKTQ